MTGRPDADFGQTLPESAGPEIGNRQKEQSKGSGGEGATYDHYGDGPLGLAANSLGQGSGQESEGGKEGRDQHGAESIVRAAHLWM